MTVIRLKGEAAELANSLRKEVDIVTRELDKIAKDKMSEAEMLRAVTALADSSLAKQKAIISSIIDAVGQEGLACVDDFVDWLVREDSEGLYLERVEGETHTAIVEGRAAQALQQILDLRAQYDDAMHHVEKAVTDNTDEYGMLSNSMHEQLDTMLHDAAYTFHTTLPVMMTNFVRVLADPAIPDVATFKRYKIKPRTEESFLLQKMSEAEWEEYRINVAMSEDSPSQEYH